VQEFLGDLVVGKGGSKSWEDGGPVDRRLPDWGSEGWMSLLM